MIRKLRRNFTAAAMLSMCIVLAVLMGAINLYNYRTVVRDADDTLSLLSENRGTFPAWMMRRQDHRGGKLPEGSETDDPGSRMSGRSPELAFSSRYFSAEVDADGSLSRLNLDNIASVDEEEAAQMAQKVASSGRSSGFLGDYRYAATVTEDGKTLITFLNCELSLASFRTFLLTSVTVSVLGLGAVFVLMRLLSGRFTRPMAESYEKQKRFITDAGHEIKTPLTIIDADAEVLSMELPENEWLEDIRAQTKRLAGLTNDLIFLSKMDEERPQLQRIDFPLSDMVSESTASFRSRALKEDKAFRVDIEPMLTLCGDEKGLRQLVNILIDNALKYSPEGGQISVKLRRSGKNALLRVTNTCDEIPEGDLNDLFDRFYRADKSRSASTGGHGLGLSIAQAVVNAHRGKLSVSAPDEHTMCFEAQLPLRASP